MFLFRIFRVTVLPSSLWWTLVCVGQYLEKLGFPVAMYRFHDVMSTEEWALEMIPSPAIAVVMLFPIKDAVRHRRCHNAVPVASAVNPMCIFIACYTLPGWTAQSEKHKADEDTRLAAGGQHVSPNVYFTKQSATAAVEHCGFLGHQG